jgi:hypothetical protein
MEDKKQRVNEKWKNHYMKYLPLSLSDEWTQEHLGDCTKDPCPCTLCVTETLLRDYREYFFDTYTWCIDELPEEMKNVEVIDEMDKKYYAYYNKEWRTTVGGYGLIINAIKWKYREENKE